MPTRRQKTERSGTFSARTVLKQATLEEVIRRPSRDHGLAGARTGFELQAVGVGVHELARGHVLPVWGELGCAGAGGLQGVFEVFVDFHDGGLITASIAVIRR